MQRPVMLTGTPMQKSIVVGCDDTVTLTAVLGSIRETPVFAHNIVSAARTSDLLGIAKTLDPDLVILCFRNNQTVLNDFSTIVKKPQIPILCLARKFEEEKLHWDKDNIVFAYPLDYVKHVDYLTSRIHSILLLSSENTRRSVPPGTLA